MIAPKQAQETAQLEVVELVNHAGGQGPHALLTSRHRRQAME